MNILLLDQTGSFVDFALRCRAAGHYPKVAMGLDKATGKPYCGGDGLIEKVRYEDWPKHMNWADLVLTSDNTKWLPELDRFRKRGFPVFAPSQESAKLELLRGIGQAAFKAAGLNVIPYEVFNDYAKAEKAVLATEERYVSKPDGDSDKALSYVSKSAADMVFMLRRWKDNPKHRGRKFMLQQFVGGCEMAVGGWIGPKGFAAYVCENFEHKKLMNDDLGVNTGEMGTVIRYTNDSALAEEVLLPMEKELIRLGHRGFVDVSVIVDEDGGPRPLEFTARLGWPLFNIQQVLHPDPVEWMADLVDGKDSFLPLPDIATGIVLTIPDFPYSKLTKKEVTGVPVYGLDDENPRRNLISPCELMAGQAPAMDAGSVVEKKLMVSCGDYLAVCSGIGETVIESSREAYRTVESLEVPNDLMYRTDIGDRLQKQLPILQESGFAKDWSYK